MMDKRRFVFKKIFFFLFLLSILSGCVMFYWPDFAILKLDSLDGTVQKGPFQKGSSIEIQELNEQLEYIGEEYIGEVNDDLGHYSIPDLKIHYPVVEVTSRGYYYNENKGVISDSMLELTALADVSENDVVNVNILTHLESARIRYLMSTGESFAYAKVTAKDEVMEAFGIRTVRVDQLHYMDICGGEPKDAMLLACSLVLQGELSTSEFSKLLDDFSEELRVDGKMDDERIVEILFYQSAAIDQDLIEKKIRNWYLEHSVVWELMFFKDYINTIKSKSYGRLYP